MPSKKSAVPAVVETTLAHSKTDENKLATAAALQGMMVC